MANLLYRLGSFSARNAWAVISFWLVVLLISAVAMVQLSGTLSSSVSLAGTESQNVIDRLQKSLPEVSRGQGQVIIRATGGVFSEEQMAEIRAALKEAAKIEGVAAVVDPFEVSAERLLQEQEVSSAQRDLLAGEAELLDADADIESGKDQISKNQAELDAQAKELETQRAELEKALAEVNLALEQAQQAGAPAPMQAPLLENQAKILAGLDQVEQGEQQLVAGQAQLDAKSDELIQAETKLESEDKRLADAELALQEAERLMTLTQGYKTLSDSGDTAIVTIQFTVPSNEVEKATNEAVIDLFSQLRSDTLQVEFSQALTTERGSVMGPGEIIGLMFAAVILFLMLGSLVAAGLPVLTAVLGVAIAISIILALSGSIEMNSSTQNLALMLGLAVGIDYSLFLINRHRRQLKAGIDLHSSISLASGTSGNAVMFAGMTVIIALVALNLSGIGFLGLMGTMGALAIALAVMLALTFTPAILSLVGLRVLNKKERAILASTVQTAHAHPVEEAVKPSLATKRPLLASFAVVLLLGLAAIPAPEMRLGLPDGSSEPEDSTTYKSFSLVSENFGEGANGLITTVVTMPQSVSEADLASVQGDLGERFFALDNVMAVLPAAVSDDGTTLLFQVIPDFGPASIETEELVFDLRELSDEISSDFGAELGVTGITASNIDISKILSDALPTYLATVLLLSLLLLVLVFRSLLLPILATSGFLLTTVATFGAVVAVYQWGWLGFLFGVHDPGPVLNFLPTILIGVLFGLAMDYQLFLASGMREAFAQGKNPKDSINHGMALSRSVVIAAALIMITVFGGFAFSHNTLIRPIGFGLAVGVLIDAFLIRLILVPSLMALFGKATWWLPAWLDRLLPNVDVEGSALERHAPAADSDSSSRASTRA